MKPDKILSRAKRPDEEFRLQWDFTNDLEAGDTRATFEVKAFLVETETPEFVEAAGWSGSGPAVVCQVQGGEDGQDYDVRFQLASTQGDKFQRVIRVCVRA